MLHERCCAKVLAVRHGGSDCSYGSGCVGTVRRCQSMRQSVCQFASTCFHLLPGRFWSSWCSNSSDEPETLGARAGVCTAALHC